MTRATVSSFVPAIGLIAVFACSGGMTTTPATAAPTPLTAVPPKDKASSYLPVSGIEPFNDVKARMVSAKAAVMNRQKALLEERYDLSSRSSANVTMSRGKPIQQGVRVKLPRGATWTGLAAMS